MYDLVKTLLDDEMPTFHIITCIADTPAAEKEELSQDDIEAFLQASDDEDTELTSNDQGTTFIFIVNDIMPPWKY